MHDDVKTRAFAGAILHWQDEVLLLKRGLHKKIAPGLWAGVGGRVEPHEVGNPLAACLREINEETGIIPEQIGDLRLRYFALLKHQVEAEYSLDSVYYFIGALKEKPALGTTDEGELRWVKTADCAELQMDTHIEAILHHWLRNPHDDTIHYYMDSEFREMKP